MKITIKLPYPPSINTYYSTVRGRRVLSKKGREYKNEVMRMKKDNVKFDGFVSVDIEMHVPDRRIRDTDNILKPIFDSLVFCGYIEDDYQISEHRVVRYAKNERGGYIILTINRTNT